LDGAASPDDPLPDDPLPDDEGVDAGAGVDGDPPLSPPEPAAAPDPPSDPPSDAAGALLDLGPDERLSFL
jgi:hypothetical protein